MSQELPYEVLKQYPGFELRNYPAYILAQVKMGGDFITAGNFGFNPLFRYISGGNQTATKISMTSPVIQATEDSGMHLVSFVLPKDISPADAPDPSDPNVNIVTREPHLAVARRFSGRWSYERFLEEAAKLWREVEATMTAGNLRGSLAGEPYFARYNSPFSPAFLRRNEVLIRWIPAL
ncbi:MAG: hypothetical protein RJA35_804 [Actinomycetota bacterium]